ncbi:MAG: rhodanese-like domain-containing protein [Verrucomicrobiota bacterium]
MKKILGVLVIALLSTVAIRAVEFPDVGIKDLKAAIEAKQVFLIDVNGSESWQEGHIPGAIDFEAKEAELAKLLPKDKNALIVAYCGGPKCTAYKEAATAAKKLGYKNVKHLSAGIAGWKSAGEKVEKGS